MSLSEVFSFLSITITAISIISAFILYSLQKRDEYVDKVIDTLQQQYGNIQTLIRIYRNGYVSYEIVKEVVDSGDSECAMKELFELYQQYKAKESNLLNIKSQAYDQIKHLGWYCRGYYIRKYDDLLESTSKLSSVYCPKYIGLYYFMETCIISLRNTMEALKTDELYPKAVEIFFFPEDKQSKYFIDVDTFEDFKHHFFDCILNYLHFANLGYFIDYINCIGGLCELVCMSHILLPMKKWHKLAHINLSKKISFSSIESIERADSRFALLKKCFSVAFDKSQSTEYDRLVAKMGNIFKKKSGSVEFKNRSFFQKKRSTDR